MNTDSTSTPASPLSADFGSRLVPLCDGRSGLRGALRAQTSQPSGSEPVIDFVASNEALDRYDEIISADGWQLDNYRRNPVFQNAHQYGDIIFTLGRALITELRRGPSTYLYQRIEFAVDVNPLARIAYGLYKGHFLNAVSVGFIPRRWQNPDGSIHPSPVGQASRPAGERGFQPLEPFPSPVPPSSPASQPACDQLRRGEDPLPALANRKSNIESPHRLYLEQELLEVSAVGIPANPEALQLALKAGAVAKTDLQVLLDLLRQLTNVSNSSGSSSRLDCASRISDFPFGAASPSHARVSGIGSNETHLLQLARELKALLSRA